MKAAIHRAESIARKNKEHNLLIRYKGYSYYKENPALSIHEMVSDILKECGLLSDD